MASGKVDRLAQIIKETLNLKENTSKITWKISGRKKQALQLTRSQERKDTTKAAMLPKTSRMTIMTTQISATTPLAISTHVTSSKLPNKDIATTPVTLLTISPTIATTTTLAMTKTTTTTATKPTTTDKTKDTIFSKYDTSSGNIYQGGEGQTGNSMVQMASTLGMAVTLSRKPLFSLYYQGLSGMFPYVKNLTFISTEAYNKIPGSHKTQIEAGFGIYNNERFLVQKHPENNLAVGYYLQSYRYFDHIKQDIKHLFTISDTLKKKAQDILHDVTGLNPALSKQHGK